MSALPNVESRRNSTVTIARGALTAIFLAISVDSSFAQSDDLIGREIDTATDSSLWRLGALHLTPAFRVGGGYDSDAILLGGSTNPDASFTVAPSIRGAVPLRDVAVIELYEEIDVVRYRTLDVLSDVFNVTRVGAAAGSSRVVLRVENEFRDDKVRPSREIDIPTDRRANRVGAAVDVSLGWRHELGITAAQYRVRYGEQSPLVGESSLDSLLDRVENRYALTFTRHLTLDTAFFLEGSFETQRFDDPEVERNARGYVGAAGLRFSRLGNVRGEARLGYRTLIPDADARPGFEGLVGAVDFTAGLGERFALQAIYSRDAVPSVLNEPLFVIESMLGAFLDVQLVGNLVIRSGWVAGTNEYPDSSPAPTSARVVGLIREFQTYSLAVRYRLAPAWSASVGVSYTTRDLWSDPAERERLMFTVGLSTAF